MADRLRTAGTDQDSVIEIVVPLRTRHAATLRVIVTSLGSDHGLSVDEIDDLKLAVSEVFTLLVDSADDSAGDLDGRAHVTYTTTHEAITVEIERTGPGTAIELDALASTILSSVVDEHRVTASGVSLVKLGREADH